MTKAFFFDLNAINGGRVPPGRSGEWRPARSRCSGAGMMGATSRHPLAGLGRRAQDVPGTDKGGKPTRRHRREGRREGQDHHPGEGRPLLGRITPTDDYARPRRLRRRDRAVFESVELKREVFGGSQD
ncbi:hypothetical protein HBB16_17810 [Pseudonocardia sp. MCCB 268]|nr:hypothetical protein [Pseudonocardia cytotoxica]